MEGVSHSEDQGLSRRQLLKKGMLIGLGAAGLSVASSALTAGVARVDAQVLESRDRHDKKLRLGETMRLEPHPTR